MNDIFTKMKSKKQTQEMEKSFDELKSQMMHFIAVSANIVNRIQNLEELLAYLLSKDEEWMKQNEMALKAIEENDKQNSSTEVADEADKNAESM
jgi:hypothetical protein